MSWRTLRMEWLWKVGAFALPLPVLWQWNQHVVFKEERNVGLQLLLGGSCWDSERRMAGSKLCTLVLQFRFAWILFTMKFSHLQCRSHFSNNTDPTRARPTNQPTITQTYIHPHHWHPTTQRSPRFKSRTPCFDLVEQSAYPQRTHSHPGLSAFNGRMSVNKS